MTTAKEDEVTSSEEAATVDIRIESKGVRELNTAISLIRICNIMFYLS